MKTRLGVLICVFFVGMILGASQPTLLYAGAETGGGNVWDQFIDPGPYPLVRLEGPLSIYYEYLSDEFGNPLYCDTGDAVAAMYYTVRLNREFDIRPNPDLYTFQGTTGTCLNDYVFQGSVIKDFLGTVVVPGIFPNFKSWKLKSIKKAQFHDDDFSRAFVVDIVIAVKK